MKHPSTIQDWIDIAKEFYEEWNFPNYIGAIDGKRIMFDCPPILTTKDITVLFY